MMAERIRAEFHCHTEYSSDSLVKIKDLLEACKRKGIDRIAITDHNVIVGAFCARELDPERVIVGEEIKTTQGEFLGYFLEEWVPPGLSPMRTIEALKKQNAFISVAHPFDQQRGSAWKPGMLEEILLHVDALEVFNARCLLAVYNDQAYRVAEEKGLGKMVGSDAHSILELGRANLILPAFLDADGLRKALTESEFSGKLSGSWVHLISTYAKLQKKIKGR